MNCERFGSDCHMGLRDLWKYKTLITAGFRTRDMDTGHPEHVQ